MKNIEDIKFLHPELNFEVTIKEYLKILLTKLWLQGEGFNSKRPWGNSSWQWVVYEALIKEGAIAGSLDEDGYIEKFEQTDADEVILNLINDIFKD